MPLPTDDLLDALEHELPRAVALRRRLHENPELAHTEHLTAATVQAELGLECEPVAGTGRVALVGGPDRRGGPVAVRAELDGLPLKEQTGASFSAVGVTMHACGHDVHMAALVALTRAAAELGERLPAPLLAIFQPSEEAYPSGARMIVETELKRLGPRAVVAAHIHPELPWGSVALDEGAVNASFDAIDILIEGEPTHGAYPHRGTDPVLALSEAIVALHAMLGRRIDPLHPATLTIGMVSAGSAENVIPALARARGALRAHREQDRLALREMTEQVVAGVATAHGCRGSVELTAGEPPLENDPGIVAGARPLLEAAGLSLAPQWRSCGSDDFAFFGEKVPVAMAFVGLQGAPGFTSHPLHHPELLPPDEAVGALARAQAMMYFAAASADLVRKDG
jgi:amidohydrolase